MAYSLQYKYAPAMLFAVFFGAAVINNATCTSSARNDSDLKIVTSPIGPVYPAATWIRLACKQNHSSPNTLYYHWTGSCNSTAEQVFQISDPLLDEQSWAIIWVKTTPVNCLDHFRCTVYEKNNDILTEIASDVFTFQHISGVGLSLPDDIFLGTIPNNSAVILDQQEGVASGGEVICHSALKSDCIGKWTNATQSLTRSIRDCTTDDRLVREADVFSSVVLDLGTITEEGMYSCVVRDEKMESHELLIGFYHSVPELTIEQSYHITSDNRLVLECGTRGSPPTATLWSRDDTLVTSDDGEDGVVSLTDYVSTQYSNTLMLTDTVYGAISCAVYSDWVSTDKEQSGRQSINSFFVVAPLSETVSLECTFPDGVTNVEWVNGSVPFESTFHPSDVGRSNTAHISLTVSEDVHGETLVCSGLNAMGRQVEKHYLVLGRVPAEAVSMSITQQPEGSTAISGDPVSLQCCADHAISEITTPPSLRWLNHQGQVLTNDSSILISSGSEAEGSSCLAIEFEAFSSESQGEYVCEATVLTSSMEPMLLVETAFQLEVIADDIGSGATPTLRAGARATDEIEIESTSTSDFLSISLTIGVAVLVFVIATTLAVLLLWVIRRRGRRSADTRSNKDSVESSNTQLQHTTTQDIKEEEKLK